MGDRIPDHQKPRGGRKSRHMEMKSRLNSKNAQVDGKSKDESTLIVDSGILANISLPRDDDFVSTWRENFSHHKALLLVMDFHTIRITRKTSGSPETWFRCKSCDFALESLDEVNVHIQTRSHQFYLRSNWHRYAISLITPSAAIINRIDEFLECEFNESYCSHDVLNSREIAFEKVRLRINQIWPDYTVRMIGSAYHCLGLRDCDLNIALSHNENNDTSMVRSFVNNLCHLESLTEEFQNIQRYLNEEKQSPYISFIWKKELPCTISILDDHSYHLAKLIKEYGKIDVRCKKLCVLFRKWAQICCLDDESDGWPPHVFYLLVIYFLQQIQDPILPVLHEIVPIANGFDDIDEHFTDVHTKWKTKNTLNVASLWIQMFKFYLCDFDPVTHIVCITQSSPRCRSSPGKRLAVMDPFNPERNITKAVPVQIYDFIMHCFKITCVYYCIPQCAEGPIFGSIRPHPKNDRILNIAGYADFIDVQSRLSHYIVRLIPHVDSNYVTDNQHDMTTILDKISTIKGLYINICSFNMEDFNQLTSISKPKPFKYKDYALFLSDAQHLMNRINPDKLHYRFTCPVFTDGKILKRHCSICAKEGHTQKTCPDLMLGKMQIPEIDKELIDLVDKVCDDVYFDSNPTEEDILMKDNVLAFLQKYISDLYPEACLTLFGSSRNGFGLKRSDMDINLTFKNCSSSSGITGNVLTFLFNYMKKCKDLKKLVYVQSAKVPIIKFLHIPSSLEGDISLYNILAQENTKLLRTYSDIDKRVKALGYMVKKFAKVCNVGDASKGSLSSYCYILMMLYFLQKCDPPVIPVLQALPQSVEPLPKKYIEECNTYFFENISELEKVWPHYKKNKMSTGELWINFLRYYTEDFDIENYVVSIRTEGLVHKLEKKWFTNVFAIEDPFIDRNLGSGLGKKMNLYIIKAFRNARSLFTSKIQPNKKKSLVDSYFNENLLAKQAPPNDRGCHICKCIGHKAKMCPQNQQRREGENKPPNGYSRGEEAKGKSNFDRKTPAVTKKRFSERNKDLMSEGEIGYVYTSNSYSSGEIIERKKPVAASPIHSDIPKEGGVEIMEKDCVPSTVQEYSASTKTSQDLPVLDSFGFDEDTSESTTTSET